MDEWRPKTRKIPWLQLLTIDRRCENQHLGGLASWRFIGLYDARRPISEGTKCLIRSNSPSSITGLWIPAYAGMTSVGRKFKNEAIEVMEIGLARRMRQRPPRFSAALILDNRRQAKPPRIASLQGRDSRQIEYSREAKFRILQLHADVRIVDIRFRCHVFPVAVEPVCRPLA